MFGQQDATDDNSSNILELSKSLRVKRNWIKSGQVDDIVQLNKTFEEKTLSEHENLVELLVGTNDMMFKRTRSFRNSSLNSSFSDSDKLNIGRAAIQNINIDTRERMPICDSPISACKSSLPGSSTPLLMDSNENKDLRTQSCSRLFSDLAKQIDEYINANADAKDEGFESDRFSGSQRSSVCSTADNEAPNFKISEPSADIAASINIDSRSTDHIPSDSLIVNKTNDVIETTTQCITSVAEIHEVEQNQIPPNHIKQNQIPPNHIDSKDRSHSISHLQIIQITDNTKTTPSKATSKSAETPKSGESSKFKISGIQIINSNPSRAASLQRNNSTPPRPTSQVSRRLFKDNAKSPLNITSQTPSIAKKTNETPRSRNPSKDKSINTPALSTSNRKIVQGPANEKSDESDERPGQLVRGSSRRKTIEPSALNKNKKIAQTISSRANYTRPQSNASNADYASVAKTTKTTLTTPTSKFSSSLGVNESKLPIEIPSKGNMNSYKNEPLIKPTKSYLRRSITKK